VRREIDTFTIPLRAQAAGVSAHALELRAHLRAVSTRVTVGGRLKTSGRHGSAGPSDGGLMILASSGGSGSAGGVAIERCTPAEIDPRRSTKPSAPVVIVHTHIGRFSRLVGAG